MKLSGPKAEAFAKRPDQTIWAALCFGDDEGVAADAAHALIASWSGKGETETVTLTEDDISRDPAGFFDALEARSLLGTSQILRIRLSGERLAKHFIEAIELGDARPGRFDNRLILIAGSLKAASKLRKTFEGANFAASLQVFPDEIRDARERVEAALHAAGNEIEPDALARFAQSLPGHRRLAHSEIEKLVLYADGLARPLNLRDIVAVSSVEIDQAMGDLVSATLSGEAARAYSELERLALAGTNSIAILRGFQREAQRLLAAHADGGDDPRIGMKLRPPVFAREWPEFRARLRKWNMGALTRLLERVNDGELAARRSGQLADAIVRNLVNDLLRLASR